MSSPRLGVKKTYKLLINGALVRTESGRSLEGPTGDNVPWASRKDVRDAVRAAHSAFPKWSGATAYNRGQILYRLAEMVEARSSEFERLVKAEGSADSSREVAVSCDRLVHYAGWCDKFAQVAGCVNPVSGPYFDFSVPEPMGVVAVAVGPGAPVLALVSQLAPVIASGNTAVVLADDGAPATACELGETLTTSDIPAGVVNVLCGKQSETLQAAVAHKEVDAIDMVGTVPDEKFWAGAADNLKRIGHHGPHEWLEPTAQGIAWIERYVETKTVWHPVGV
ncbi:MAG: aldehyde dehydrogenase family protein [Fimbriimonadaceae bacterium]